MPMIMMPGGAGVDPMMQAYLEMERLRGDGPSTGNNFLGYGSLQAASDAILGPGRMQSPGMAPQAATMPQQGAQGMMGMAPMALTMPPVNESPMAMSRRYAEALLGGARAPAGMQNVLNVPTPFQTGQMQPSRADIQSLIAAELMRQQPRQRQMTPQERFAAFLSGNGGNSAFGGGVGGFGGGVGPQSGFGGGDPDSYSGGGPSGSFSGGNPDAYG